MEKKNVICRACESYNPTEHLIDIQQSDGSTAKYLLVHDRVAFFNCYCEENNIRGLIDDSEVEYIEPLKMFRATCSVYMNGELVGKSTGSCVYDDDMKKSVEIAATSAKGRALANAGFGTAMCSIDDPEPNPCDAGITTGQNGNVQPTVPAPKTDEVPKKEEKPVEPKPDNQTVMPKTLEEAQKIICDIKGEHCGRSFGEIMAIAPDFVRFIAEKYNARKHPEYPVAAQIILRETFN